MTVQELRSGPVYALRGTAAGRWRARAPASGAAAAAPRPPVGRTVHEAVDANPTSLEGRKHMELKASKYP